MIYNPDLKPDLDSDSTSDRGPDRSPGIVDLMTDLGEALNTNPDMLFLGGGNPARIDAFERVIEKELVTLAQHHNALHSLVGIYQSPKGSEAAISALASYLRSEGWPVSEDNICFTHGSQSAFFILLNFFAGSLFHAHAQKPANTKKICLPLVPEYLGYSDQGFCEDMFLACPPKVELIGDHAFKYHIDFEALNVADCAAICLSRPTNPSGNVPSDSEIEHLARLAKTHDIPLIMDCAYGDPFPGVVYTDAQTTWQPNNVMVLSLSKLGLPGARTGIVIADKSIIDAISRISTVMSLANGNLGPALLTSLIESKRLNRLRDDILVPFYRAKRAFILKCLERALANIPYRIHRSEGAFFIWLWFPELPIRSTALYERLKQRSVLVMDGSHFFFGLPKLDDSQCTRTGIDFLRHQTECIRLTYCQPDDVIAKSIDILAEELAKLYCQS